MEFWIILQREYRERVFNKTFLISTLFGLIVILGLSFAPAIIDKIKSADRQQITVIEASGQITAYLEENLKDTLPNGERQFSFQALTANASDWSTKKKEGLDQLLAGKTSAVLEFAPPDEPEQIIWHSKKIRSKSFGIRRKSIWGEPRLKLRQL